MAHPNVAELDAQLGTRIDGTRGVEFWSSFNSTSTRFDCGNAKDSRFETVVVSNCHMYLFDLEMSIVTYNAKCRRDPS